MTSPAHYHVHLHPEKGWGFTTPIGESYGAMTRADAQRAADATRQQDEKAASLPEWDAAGEAEAEFVAKVAAMEEPELCQRILAQWRSLGDFLNCLRGLEIPAPYGKSYGVYLPDEIRDIVTGLLRRPSDLAKAQLAARQCERMARYFAPDSVGEAKAAGYRHAVHIFRTIGGLDIPEASALRAATDLPGTLPPAELFTVTP